MWSHNIQEELHLTRMIDAIFEDEILWIGSYQTRDRYAKYPDPEKWIFSPSPGSYYSKWESVFSIIMMKRVSNIFVTELLREEPSNMRRDSCLADCTRDTDDVWLMSRDDESSKKSEK